MIGWNAQESVPVPSSRFRPRLARLDAGLAIESGQEQGSRSSRGGSCREGSLAVGAGVDAFGVVGAGCRMGHQAAGPKLAEERNLSIATNVGARFERSPEA